MIRGIGADNALAKAAIDAAKRSVQSDAARIERASAEIGAFDVGGANKTSSAFTELLEQGLNSVNKAARTSEELPLQMLAGDVNDFHEVAAALKQSELVFKFSLEVRNKLIDAYRETMRMSV